MPSEETTREIENFAHNLRWLRETNGLSKKQMASLLRMGVGTLDKLETGIIPPRLSVKCLFLVWQHFDVPPAEQLSRQLDE